MKSLNRSLTNQERTILILLGLIAIALLYYLAVYRPVTEGIEQARLDEEELQLESDLANAKLLEVQQMQREMDTLQAEGGRGLCLMPSYNSSEAELDFLHTTLAAAMEYYVGFSNVTRNGNQIRRSFSLQYKAQSYADAVRLIDALEQSEIRCLVGNVSFASASGSDTLLQGNIQVSCNAVFYETLYGGVADKDLP